MQGLQDRFCNRTYFGSPTVAQYTQPWLPGDPQFKLPAGVPSIQAQPRFTDVAALDCDAPTQKVAADTLREKAYRPLVLDVPANVSRCEFIGHKIIAVNQLRIVIPVTFKHDAWPSEPSLSL